MRVEDKNYSKAERPRFSNKSLITTAALLIPVVWGVACGQSAKESENNGQQVVPTSNTLNLASPTESELIAGNNGESEDPANSFAESPAEIGEQAPDFEVKRLNGEMYRLSENFGKKPVYIAFSINTGDLHKQFEMGFKLREMFNKDQLEIIFITIAGETLEDTDAFTVVNASVYEVPALQRYGNYAPNDYFLDKNGTIVAQRDGISYDMALNISKMLIESQDPALALADLENPTFPLDSQFSPENGLDYESRVGLITDVISQSMSDTLIDTINGGDQNYNHLISEKLGVIKDRLDWSLGDERDASFSPPRTTPVAYTDRLIEAGRMALEDYCQTNDARFQSILSQIASLTYYEITAQVQKGRLDSNKWQLEQINRHFDTAITCNSIFAGI